VSNCLVSGNLSGANGGGIFCGETTGAFAHCTVTGNTASGQGGGIACGNGSVVGMTECILWGNSAGTGHEIGLKSVTNPSTLTITYSDVEDGSGGAAIDTGCVLNLNTGTINADPQFVAGDYGDCYLGQIAAGQDTDSPCVDTGSDTAEDCGLDESTTRTDNGYDAGTVDMGYHYTAIVEISITSIVRDTDDITIEWDPQAGVGYVVQWSTDMEIWNDVFVGETGTWTDTSVSEPYKLYRVTTQ
jgi:predicted outer membrane repeat protein